MVKLNKKKFCNLNPCAKWRVTTCIYIKLYVVKIIEHLSFNNCGPQITLNQQ